VNGYQDIIFDAMMAMEGQELIPTVDTYNAVIHAFARACNFPSINSSAPYKLIHGFTSSSKVMQ
jgi:hypothetical protein